MKQYEKIETIFARDTEGTKLLMPGVFRNPSVHFLASVGWDWTEKIDGTNIRVLWDGHGFVFGGRTDNANLPVSLVLRLNEIFLNNAVEELFEQTFGDKEVLLFGEGYGAKIQKVGAHYIPDGVDFILFDVLINGNYQDRENVENIARMIGIKVVPIVGYGSLYRALEFMKEHPQSRVAAEPLEMEGIVCRPHIEMRDRCGNRIIVKIKWADIKEMVMEKIRI